MGSTSSELPIARCSSTTCASNDRLLMARPFTLLSQFMDAAMNRISFLARIVPPLLFVACGAQTQDDSGTATGGKTNWFGRCDETADCAALEDSICAERVCTR